MSKAPESIYLRLNDKPGIMIIVKLMGGLGNQMFQYALGRSLAWYHNTAFKMDTSFLLDRSVKAKNFVFRDYDLDIFNVKESFATPEEVHLFTRKLFPNKTLDSLFKKLSGSKNVYFKEPYFHLYQRIFELGNNIYLDGYWQSPKYFKNYEPLIRQEFTFKNPVNSAARPLLDAIENSNSVCVNVRRGDFLTSSMHNVMTPEYFKTAESMIRGKLGDPHYFIFADDMEWCRQNLQFTGQVTFVSNEYAGYKYSDKLHLMTLCKHFIIPNSTYGWWAAWLSTRQGKIVIAPAKWFNDPAVNTTDLVPADWLRI